MLERKSERIEFIAPGGSEQTAVYDLSKTGVSFFHAKPKEKNSFVIVKINELLLRAKVIYCQQRENDYRLGLQFWNILPERQLKLNEIVDRYSKGVPIKCALVEEKEIKKTEETPQDTKRIITKDMKKEVKKDPKKGTGKAKKRG